MALLLIAALVGGAIPSGELTVAVVPSVSGVNGPRLSLLYDLARRALEERAEVVVLPLEASFPSEAESVLDRCGSDDRCTRAALGETGAHAALLVVLLGSGDRWIARVDWLLLRRSGGTSATETVDSGADLERTVARMIARVLDEAGVERGPRTIEALAPELATTGGEPSFYETWWFWSAVGAVAVGSALAIGLTARSPSPCLCLAASLERCESICDGR